MFRLLIVEDEDISRKGLMMTVPWSMWNVEIIGEAKNGEEGYALARKLKPDIIITDIRMPLMSGLEMVEKLSIEEDVVFIVLSAYSEFEYAKKALQLGAVDYLLKPFTDDQLYEAIQNAQQSVVMLKEAKQRDYVSRQEMMTTVNRYLSKSDRSKHENIRKIITYVQEKYPEDITLTTAAEYLNVSESYLSRLFRSETSYSFHEYLTVYRIKMACELLMEPQNRIYEVSRKVGYRDQRYFSVVFKKYMGMTPKHFKEQY